MRRSKDIGTDAERAVARWLNINGWPSAEMRRSHGELDLGDITGTPGLVFEVKGGHQAETATDTDITDWLAETDNERGTAHADVGVLIWKRKGKGYTTGVGAWWAALPGWAFVYLVESKDGSPYATAFRNVHGLAPPVRMLLADAVWLLRRAGYGDLSWIPAVGDTA